MKAFPATLALGFLIVTNAESLHGQPQDAAVLGAWEGESKCMVAGSPCHDEHVIYEIARNETPAGHKIDAYKVVNGAREFMGTLHCSYNAQKKLLSCTGGNPRMKSDWEYSVSGDKIDGTLVLGDERTLYRKISLHRMAMKD